MRNIENLYNTIKALRWQEASLETSKGFYKGSESNHTVQTPHAPKTTKILKIYEDLKESTKTYGNLL